MTALRWILAIIAAIGGGYLLKRWLLFRQISNEQFPPIAHDRPRAGPSVLAAGEASSAPRVEAAGERRAEPDPGALAGSSGPKKRIGFDLDRLRQRSSEFQPLVEHLSFIQLKRGETESLMFVRNRDIDALAALTGMSKEAFVEEFQEMGVLVSMN